MVTKNRNKISEDERAFAERLFQHMVVPTFVLDGDGQIILWNNACQHLTGVRASEVLGTREHWKAFYDRERPCLADLVVQNRVEGIDKLYPNHKVTPLGLQAENWCVMPKKGTSLYLAIDAIRIFDAERRLVAVVETLRDITPQREAEISFYEPFERWLGASAVMRDVAARVREVAQTDTDMSVLIVGESGTGKEGVANAIHRSSERRDGPFVAVHCAACPETLIESELFGHEKDTFTGAKKRIGRFEQANGGTLFLDEVGEIPLSMQVKLLRVLDKPEFTRLGGNELLKVDIRVVAATNANLLDLIQKGRFREDLYHRLAGEKVTLPPLRDRGDDAVVLAERFMVGAGASSGRAVTLSAEAKRAILAYHWPGNVRELKNVIRSAVHRCKGEEITPADLKLRLNPPPAPPPKPIAQADIEAALDRSGGNIQAAAREIAAKHSIEFSRHQLYRLIAKLGIDVERFRRS